MIAIVTWAPARIQNVPMLDAHAEDADGTFPRKLCGKLSGNVRNPCGSRSVKAQHAGVTTNIHLPLS